MKMNNNNAMNSNSTFSLHAHSNRNNSNDALRRQRNPSAAARGSVIAKAGKAGGPNEMKFFMTYLSSAPVLLLVVGAGLSGLVIEINRYFPDLITLASGIPMN